MDHRHRSDRRDVLTDLREPPVLGAGDYTLRPWSMADLHAVREASTDPLIPLITTVPPVYSDAEGIAFVERQWGRPAAGRYPMVIARASDGCAVGNVGLDIISADRATVGYWVLASARRAGAAGSALKAITEWGLHELGIARLDLYAEPWNTGSLRTAESAGYQREGLLRDWARVGGELKDVVMYAALRTPR
ncbi:GNAT family N-acetyltransferase [Streptomyces sp. NPDC088197]|uniref:GNAT family N-acetyltransferase n=1 Tax=unclassified Streptomyces TaxID=2593676 RepID=UPI003820C5D9